MLRKRLSICCQHGQDRNTELLSSVLALTLSYSHCLQKSTETGQTQQYSPSTAPHLQQHAGVESLRCQKIFFVSTRHSFLGYLLLFLVLLLLRQGKHLERKGCKISVLLHERERAETGRSETGIMGNNKERNRNGCRKSVLGKIKILCCRIPMIALFRSVTMAS